MPTAKVLNKASNGWHSIRQMFHSTPFWDSSESESPSNQEVTEDHETESLKTQDLVTDSEDIKSLRKKATAPTENANEITSPSN